MKCSDQENLELREELRDLKFNQLQAEIDREMSQLTKTSQAASSYEEEEEYQ